MTEPCRVGDHLLGAGQPLAVIAGPCVLEGGRGDLQVGRTIRDACEALHLPFIFKASYDKANRSSIRSKRGPGLEQGLRELDRIRSELGVPVTTDVHHPEEAARAAEVVDLLQVPAFLCRQTDLLLACARTGRAVNVKKGQFLSPTEMRHVVDKLRENGGENIILTERGTFFGYHRLVNDFIGLGDLMEIGPPICFDVTHSTQLPGAGHDQTAGRPERAGLLARAAVAAGVHAVFIEAHPQPARSPSDSATVQALDAVPGLLRELQAIRRALSGDAVVTPG